MARALITGSLKLWVRAQWIALMTVGNGTFAVTLINTGVITFCVSTVRGCLQKPSAGFIPVGTTAELTRCFTLKDIQAFAQLAGDDNPIHVDENFAAASRFGK